MRQIITGPFADSDGAVVFEVRGAGPLRLRRAWLVREGAAGRRRLVTRRRLLAFAAAVEAGTLPVRLPGTGATAGPDPEGRLPYVVVTWPGGRARAWAGPLAEAARSTARS